MKKKIITLCAGIMALTLAGCSGSSERTGSVTGEDSQVPATEVTADSQPSSSDNNETGNQIVTSISPGAETPGGLHRK